MDSEKTHHVTVRLARAYEFVAEFNDTPDAPAILFDEPPPLGGSRAPDAVAVLGAAIGNCLAASLTFCLRQAHFDVQGMTAEVTTHVAKNEKGHYRVHDVEVQLAPSLGESGGSMAECRERFDDFCVVTASVQHGIPVRVSLKASSLVAD
jgi:organic hydroperoxide reductase OsmC/OhrA